MTVVIYAATGWTGARVARALDRSGIPLRLAGRSRDKLEALARGLSHDAELAIAATSDDPSIARAFKGADAVVNCAGPFVDSGIRILDAAIAARAHYIDVSGEESHVAAVYGRDVRAKERGVTVCPAFAGKGALGDLGAAWLAGSLGDEPIEEVAIAYAHALREAMRPSQASILSIAGQGVFRPAGFATAVRSFGFPPPFRRGLALLVPATECISIPRHLSADRVNGYIALAPGHDINHAWARLCVAAMPLIPYVARALFSDWGRWHLALYMQPPETAEDQDSFAASIELTTRSAIARLSILAHDAYGVTADLVTFGVTALLAGTAPAGVLAPSELCDARAALETLQRGGVIRLFQPRHAHTASPLPTRRLTKSASS